MPTAPLRPMRLIFVGHAAVVAHALRLGGDDVVAVVVPASPSALRNLARSLRAHLRPARRSPIEHFAHAHGAPMFGVRTDADWSAVATPDADLLVCAGFPRRIPPRVFESLPLGGINVHPSLLPAHRGPRPVEHTILAGDPTTGVTIHRLTADFDAGPILWSCESPVLPTDSCAALTQRLLSLAAGALPPVLAELCANPSAGRAQLLSPLERRPTADALRPDLFRATEAVRRRVMAANGGRFVDERGVSVAAVAASPWPGIQAGAADAAPRTEPGTVLAQSGAHVLVATGNGAIWLTLEKAPHRRLLHLRAHPA